MVCKESLIKIPNSALTAKLAPGRHAQVPLAASSISATLFRNDLSTHCRPHTMFTHVRTYVHVCMYVRTYVCMYVRMYVCMYVCIYVCTYVCMYVRTYVHMYVSS